MLPNSLCYSGGLGTACVSCTPRQPLACQLSQEFSGMSLAEQLPFRLQALTLGAGCTAHPPTMEGVLQPKQNKGIMTELLEKGMN